LHHIFGKTSVIAAVQQEEAINTQIILHANVSRECHLFQREGPNLDASSVDPRNPMTVSGSIPPSLAAQADLVEVVHH